MNFILASGPMLKDSARNCMELTFMLTSWDYTTEGRNATDFSESCDALGVSFDLTRATDGVLLVQNTKKRIDELLEFISAVMEQKKLHRHQTLKLRGCLGFLDGFLHGKLGSLILKRLIERAYGFSNHLDESLLNVLALIWSA